MPALLALSPKQVLLAFRGQLRTEPELPPHLCPSPPLPPWLWTALPFPLATWPGGGGELAGPQCGHAADMLLEARRTVQTQVRPQGHPSPYKAPRKFQAWIGSDLQGQAPPPAHPTPSPALLPACLGGLSPTPQNPVARPCPALPCPFRALASRRSSRPSRLFIPEQRHPRPIPGPPPACPLPATSAFQAPTPHWLQAQEF